jgi:hypothetical protein
MLEFQFFIAIHPGRPESLRDIWPILASGQSIWLDWQALDNFRGVGPNNGFWLSGRQVLDIVRASIRVILGLHGLDIMAVGFFDR